MAVSLTRTTEGASALLPLATLRRLAQRTVRSASSTSVSLELSVAFVSTRRSRQANERYRGKPEATDVLSFVLTPPSVRTQPRLAEILLCPTVIRRRARRSGNPVAAETAMLFVHGLLHILGYDHRTERDFRAMQRQERMILGDRYDWGEVL